MCRNELAAGENKNNQVPELTALTLSSFCLIQLHHAAKDVWQNIIQELKMQLTDCKETVPTDTDMDMW